MDPWGISSTLAWWQDHTDTLILILALGAMIRAHNKAEVQAVNQLTDAVRELLSELRAERRIRKGEPWSTTDPSTPASE